jgi:hypothetical protein
MSFQPNNIVTGDPVVSTAGRNDNSQIIDWYAWFFEPITFTDGVDDSQITDWYAWFFEPITYANTELTQAHNLTSTSVSSDSPQIQSTEITENHPVVADNIITGIPFASATSLVEDYNLSSADVETGSPEVSNSPLTQAHSISVLGVLSGQILVSTAGLIQRHGFQANDLTFGQPTTTDPTISQNNSLSSSGITTGQVEVSPATMAEDETFSAPNLVTGLPETSATILVQLHGLTATGVSTGSPETSVASFVQDYLFSPVSVATETPEIPSVAATIVRTTDFTTSDVLTGTPEVSPTSITQNNALDANETLTGRPVAEDATNPDVILTQEIDQMFGGWQRRTYEVPDGRLVQSEREIQSTYGDVVSIDKKAKSLIKFGKSAPLTTDSLQTVWTVGGNEVYLSDDGITHISSSSTSDTQEIRVEGHTISGDDLTFVVQLVTLNGQTPVALNTGLARVSRISNNNGTELVGRVVAYEDTAVTGGIPTDATKIHIDIPLGFQQSFKAATSFSKEDYYVMTGFYGAVSAKQSAAVDFYVEVKEPDGVFLQKACFTASSSGGNSDISLDPAIIVPKNSDVRVRCETSDNNAVVFGIFKGYLAKVTG